MKILTKAQFYELCYRSALGNTVRQWDYSEFVRLRLEGVLPKDITGYAVRVKTPDNPYMKYELNEVEALEYSNYLVLSKGLVPALLNISELAPDHRLTLQGEVRRSSTYCDGWLRTKFSDDVTQNRMRSSYPDVCKDSKHMSGLAMWSTIKDRMDAQSWDCLQELFDTYDDVVYEFACYDVPVGVLQWNTLSWELRSY